jgi:hypothetical protein
MVAALHHRVLLWTQSAGTPSFASPRSARTASINRSGVNAEADSSACCSNGREFVLKEGEAVVSKFGNRQG